jgi:hypothetical protein
MNLSIAVGLVVVVLFAFNIFINAWSRNVPAMLGWGMATLFASAFYFLR